jgi:hypothetical protein
LPLKISEEEKFEIARASRKIKNASEEEIRQALRYVMVKIGLRAANFPSGIEKQLLIMHVFENFGENRIDEIRLAFDWGIEGRLDEDINCFENFSCLYFTKIMRAYNRLALAVKTKEEIKPIALPAPPKKEGPRIEDPEAYEKFLKTGCAKWMKDKGIEIKKW